MVKKLHVIYGIRRLVTLIPTSLYYKYKIIPDKYYVLFLKCIEVDNLERELSKMILFSTTRRARCFAPSTAAAVVDACSICILLSPRRVRLLVAA
jgi:hypothetical protein